MWFDVGSGNRVNLVRKQVENSDLNCTDETILLARAAQAYLVRDPLMQVGTEITLLLKSSGERQKFKRIYTSGSVQFGPTTACGK